MERIKDLKTRGIGTYDVQADASIEDAVLEFLDKCISALIVYDGKKMVGIFTKNDLVRCCASNPDGIRGLKVADYMKTNVLTTTVDADLDEVMETMVEKGWRHMPVVEGKRVVGMVTAADILIHQKRDLGQERDELLRYIRGSY